MPWPPIEREVGEQYHQANGARVEIVAVDRIESEEGWAVDALAYRFMGGAMIHLRSVESTKFWQKVVTG